MRSVRLAFFLSFTVCVGCAPSLEQETVPPNFVLIFADELWPARIPPGQVTLELASTMDLYTTFLLLAGADVPGDRPVDGKDIMPMLEGEGTSPHEYFYYMYPARLEAVRDAMWKLWITASGQGGAVVTELFNLSVDPYERFNVADDNPDVVARLRAEMERFAAETGAALAPGH